MKTEALCRLALALGAAKARVLQCKDLVLSREFRAICEKNQCGKFGRCWMCPPDCGDIDTLMAQLQNYSAVLWYQSIHPLEDSFDIEGMLRAARAHSRLSLSIRRESRALLPRDCLYLSSGGCQLCPVCARQTGEACRFPGEAMPSLEAYGIDVYQTTAPTELSYINGKNTVTFFGAVLWR
ncbi:MAG: DUF2284 domain-containing protein [Oscillospiraceae bacterium]|nr:DUF2284 domain-containing protein [Oscillospiraceae bacterium]